MLLWKINLPSGSICFSCSTWSHLSLQVRVLSAVSHLQEGVWSNPRQNWPWFISTGRGCAVPLWADSEDRHRLKMFLPEVLISIQQIWQCYFIFLLLHQCSSLLMVTHCQHKCLEKQIETFRCTSSDQTAKRKYPGNPAESLFFLEK